MTIQSETFYRAQCDADGCENTYPDDDDEGASHYPLDSLLDYLVEPGGEYDEPWTIDGDRHFCRRHSPGNVDCARCDSEGFVRTGEDDPGKRWEQCTGCGGRGYVAPEPPISSTEEP